MLLLLLAVPLLPHLDLLVEDVDTTLILLQGEFK